MLHLNCGLRMFQKSVVFDLTVESQEPTEWVDLIRISLHESPLVKGLAAKEPVFADKRDVDPKLFNKHVFKENWSRISRALSAARRRGRVGRPLGPYRHKHNDINTISTSPRTLSACGSLTTVVAT